MSMVLATKIFPTTMWCCALVKRQPVFVEGSFCFWVAPDIVLRGSG